MSEGLLSKTEKVRIRLGANKEILSASDAVFDPVYQEEGRNMIYELGYLGGFASKFSTLLGLGEVQCVSVAEQDRQTSYLYQGDQTAEIVLTKAHRSMHQILSEPKANS